MSEINDNELKLIFVLKIGNNTKNEGLYEFIFSTDPTNINIEDWGWDLSPACDNAEPPTNEFYNQVIQLKSQSFDLFCLHESIDREYMHGYHTIHALAYETTKEHMNENYDDLDFEETDDDKPLFVFHYGVSLKDIKEMFYERDILFEKNKFIEVKSKELD